MKYIAVLAIILLSVVLSACSTQEQSPTNEIISDLQAPAQEEKQDMLVISDIGKKLDEVREREAQEKEDEEDTNSKDNTQKTQENNNNNNTDEQTSEDEESTVSDAQSKNQEQQIDLQNLEQLEVQETELVTLNPQVVDEDGDSLTYTYSWPLDNTGQWQTNYGDEGEYPITITVSDGEHTVEQTILLIVRKKNEAPTIAGLSDITATEGDRIELTYTVNDVNEDQITTTVSSPIGDDNSWQTDHTSAGEYTVTVSASDGEKTTERQITVTVQNKNFAPTIADLDPITVKEGELVTLNPNVNDVDSDDLTITFSAPLNQDGQWQTGYQDNGRYTLEVTVEDEESTVSASTQLVVEDVNVPPTITGITLR